MPDIKEYWIREIADTLEFGILADIENDELGKVKQAIDNLLDDQFIETATEYGIARREAILDIIPYGDDTLETRRFRVAGKWMNKLPYTRQMLQERLDALLGTGYYKIELHNEAYVLTIEMRLVVPRQLELITEMLDEMVPANLLYRLILVIYGQIEVSLIWDKHIFQPPLCGTLKSYNVPCRSTLGEIISGIINAAVQSAAAAFEPPLCNDIVCGVYPSTSTVSYIVSGGITGSTAYARANSNPPLCNTIVCGEVA